MRRSLGSVPAAGRPLRAGSLAALAAPGCGHEEKIDYTSVSKPPTVRLIQPRGPEHRPGRRAAELHRELRAHVDLSEADRLHREVDRGHRRQGEEGRRARHALRARAGRGLRDEEGDRQARRGAGRAGPEDGGGGRRRRQGGRGAASTRPRRSWASTRPRSTAGTSEVKRLKREVERGVVDPQILLESTNQWKSNIAARDAAKATIAKAEAELLSERGHAREGQGRRRGRPGRPGRGRRARRSGSRRGSATSRSPHPTTA